MLLLSLMIAMSDTRWFSLGASGLLLLSIWIQIVQRFVFRLSLGHVDTIFRYLAADRIKAQTAFLNERSGSRSITTAQDFVFLFGRLFVVLILSYAAVFCALDRASAHHFAGLNKDSWRKLDMIYFSIVTVATVGYGDILPKTSLARALVSSEIMAAFFFFILFLSSFGLGNDPLFDNNVDTSKRSESEDNRTDDA